jgi:hypothetical protein
LYQAWVQGNFNSRLLLELRLKKTAKIRQEA